MLAFALVVMGLCAVMMGFSVFALAWPLSFGWPFWPAALMGHAAAWMLLLPLLGFLSLVLVVWYYWRLLSGFVRALDDRPY